MRVQLLAAGRDADVYHYGEGLVLRRYRDGRPAGREARIQRSLHALGYPVPAVISVDGPDIVMERVDGPDLAAALLGGLPIVEGAAMLARLLDTLHALPWPSGTPLLHLDLHPLNVLVGPDGPVVIDWVNAEPGPPGLDVAMTAVILAQIAVTPPMEEVRALANLLLSTFLQATTAPYSDHLDEAATRRRNDHHRSPAEVAALDTAVELIRAARAPGAGAA